MPNRFSSFRIVTYSPSFTLSLTHRCLNHCHYCAFRQESGSLRSPQEIETLLDRARRKGAVEVLILSGERINEIDGMREELELLGYSDYIDYATDICRRAVERGLLPHTNIGVLKEDALKRLASWNASMGLMLENSDPRLAKRIHPQKNIAERIETIAAAGRLQIPFTTGILVGLGESRASRLDSLRCIGDLHRQYGQIQEIILQNYVPNEKSSLPEYPLTPAEWEEMMAFVRKTLPGVKIQIPPNLNPDWLALVLSGADDLGGISPENDFVNVQRPWEKPIAYEMKLKGVGLGLSPRLPIYRDFFQRGWYSPTVGEKLKQWVKRDEFRYYCQKN